MSYSQFIVMYEWGTLASVIAIAALEIANTGAVGDIDELVRMIVFYQVYLLAILTWDFAVEPFYNAFLSPVCSAFVDHLTCLEEPVVTLPAIQKFAERHGLHAAPGSRSQDSHAEASEEQRHKSTGRQAGDKSITLERRLHPSLLSDDVEINKDIELKEVSQPFPAHEHSKEECCLLLRKLPLEARRLVYAELLIAGIIENAFYLVYDKVNTLVYSEKDQRLLKFKIDSTVLRTCRQIYDEALPMLYQDNTFVFSDSIQMSGFRDKGLPEKPDPSNYLLRVPAFRFAPCSQGRLSLIRKLVLNLTNETAQRSYRLVSGRWVPTRSDIQSMWTEFFQENLYEDDRYRPRIRFPSLTDLLLNFSDWNLTADDALVVRPFVQRLETAEKLNRLEIRGVLHLKSLEELRKGLLKENGIFVVTCGRILEESLEETRMNTDKNSSSGSNQKDFRLSSDDARQTFNNSSIAPLQAESSRTKISNILNFQIVENPSEEEDDDALAARAESRLNEVTSEAINFARGIITSQAQMLSQENTFSEQAQHTAVLPTDFKFSYVGPSYGTTFEAEAGNYESSLASHQSQNDAPSEDTQDGSMPKCSYIERCPGKRARTDGEQERMEKRADTISNSERSETVPQNCLAMSEIYVNYNSTPTQALKLEHTSLKKGHKSAFFDLIKNKKLEDVPYAELIAALDELKNIEISPCPLSNRSESIKSDACPLIDTSENIESDSCPLPNRPKSIEGGTSSSIDKPKSSESCPCPLFGKWPLEIRELLYKLLLVAGHITHPGQLVENDVTTFVYKEHEKPSNCLGIDSTILRTCRRIYNEALPILYGHNNFVFDNPRSIEAFRQESLVDMLLDSRSGEFNTSKLSTLSVEGFSETVEDSS
ncbi:MAG: hypothetical protein Q9191_005537 [Dirinaria sp. TL-2023a]